jgi:hypothetical protein
MEAAEFLTSAAQSARDPMTSNVINYLAMKNQDWAGAEEAASLMKKLIPPEILKDEDEDPNSLDAQKQQMQQAAQMMGQKEAELNAHAEQLQQASQQMAQMEESARAQEQKAKDAMVRAQAKLVDYLGIDELFCVAGGSMGGMQVLQWAALFPQRVFSAMPIAAGARHSSQNIAFHEVGRQAIMADPDWEGGRYFNSGKRPVKGLAVARTAGARATARAMSRFGLRGEAGMGSLLMMSKCTKPDASPAANLSPSAISVITCRSGANPRPTGCRWC